MAETSA